MSHNAVIVSGAVAWYGLLLAYATHYSRQNSQGGDR